MRLSLRPQAVPLTFEFHISRRARERYALHASLFSTDGRVIVADFSAARVLAEAMTRVTGAPVPAGEINALG